MNFCARLARVSGRRGYVLKDTLGYFVRTCWAGVNRAGGTHSAISLEEQVTADLRPLRKVSVVGAAL